jgi:hypothetical protein
MPRAGFEPTTPAGGRTQTNALDRTATGIGKLIYTALFFQGRQGPQRTDIKMLLNQVTRTS